MPNNSMTISAMVRVFCISLKSCIAAESNNLLSYRSSQPASLKWKE